MIFSLFLKTIGTKNAKVQITDKTTKKLILKPWNKKNWGRLLPNFRFRVP